MMIDDGDYYAYCMFPSIFSIVSTRFPQALLQSALAWNDISPSEIGVITPYAAQARLIRRRLGCPAPGKRAPEGAVGVALVEVSSVDGFQGREKDTETPGESGEKLEKIGRKWDEHLGKNEKTMRKLGKN